VNGYACGIGPLEIRLRSVVARVALIDVDRCSGTIGSRVSVESMTLDPSRSLPSLAVVREWQRVTFSVISPPITGPIIISQLGVASTKRRIKTKGGDCEKQAANGRLRWNEARLSCAVCSMPGNDAVRTTGGASSKAELNWSAFCALQARILQSC
jgi:hypothetical protein